MNKTLLTVALLLFTSLMSAVTFGWCPSPDTSVTGYRLYYGVGNVTNWQPQVTIIQNTNYPCNFVIVSGGANWSRNYTNSINVGNTNQVILNNTNFTVGLTYYFAMVAYDANGVESDPSNEERHIPTNPPPTRPSSPTNFKLFDVK